MATSCARWPDKAPPGTAMVYLASYSPDPTSEVFHPVIAALTDPDALDEVARWFGRRIEDGGLSWDGAYLRGPDEPYARIPNIRSVFVLEQPNAIDEQPDLPVTQYAFVDRQSAEAHAAWRASVYGRAKYSCANLHSTPHSLHLWIEPHRR